MNPKAHRYAVLLAIGSLIPIALGAFITSKATGPQPAARAMLDAVVHKDVAIGVGVVGVGFLIRLLWMDEESLLVATAVSLFAIECLIGWMGRPFLHATFAPVLFAALVAIASVTSPAWSEPPERVEDQSGSALRLLAFSTPPLVLLEIMLGAAYRHKLAGLLPHLGFAMVVTLPILALAMLILQRHPEHRRLCRASAWLITILVTQVVLGISALVVALVRVNALAATTVSAAHVVAGSLTLALNGVLALEVERSVDRTRRSAEQPKRI